MSSEGVIFFADCEKAEIVLKKFGIKYRIGNPKCSLNNHSDCPIITEGELKKFLCFFEVTQKECCENIKIADWREKKNSFQYEWEPRLGFAGSIILGLAEIKTSFNIPESELEKIRKKAKEVSFTLNELEIISKSGIRIDFFSSGFYEVSDEEEYKVIPFAEVAKEHKVNLAILIGQGRFYQAFKIITRMIEAVR